MIKQAIGNLERLERDWNKIAVGEICTDFLKRNNLFRVPHVFAYKAVKISEELVGVYSSVLFDFKKYDGEGKYLITCLSVDGSLIPLDYLRISFMQKMDTWEIEEIE